MRDIPSQFQAPLSRRVRDFVRRLGWRIFDAWQCVPRISDRGVVWLGLLFCCFGFWWMVISAVVALLTRGAS
jgi:hypothetical protein